MPPPAPVAPTEGAEFEIGTAILNFDVTSIPNEPYGLWVEVSPVE